MEDSRVALITGAGRGLGRAFALALANHGWRVSVASRSPRELDATLAAMPEGAAAIASPADVTDESQVANMIRRTEETLGPVGLLVNNAGIGPPFGPVWESAAGEWWRNVEVNLKGPFLCSRAVLPGMVSRGSGRIINVASGAGTISIPHLSAYVTAKTALIRLTEVLADELRPHGVRVFAIEPGTVRTAMSEQLLGSEAGQRWLPWFQRIFDERRDVPAKPAEDLVLHLASGKADALSGHFFAAPGAGSGPAGQAKAELPGDLGVLRLKS